MHNKTNLNHQLALVVVVIFKVVNWYYLGEKKNLDQYNRFIDEEFGII